MRRRKATSANRVVGEQVKSLAVILGNQPIHGSARSRLLQPCDLMGTHAGLAALKLNESHVQEVAVLSAEAECDGVNDPSSGRSGSAFKEGHAPAVGFAVRSQSVFAGGLGCVGLCKRAEASTGPHRFRSRSAALSCAGGLLSCREWIIHGFFPQRALAAFAAIWERFFGPREAARAAPPFSPPKRPRATAAGFFFFTSGGFVAGTWPVDSSMIRYASSFGSRGRVFERSGMMPTVWQGAR